MPLSRLIYASRASDALAPDALDQILESSRRNNAKLGVSGALLFGSREFLQCLEGSREAVNHTYARILGDPRHADVQMIEYREVGRRLFPDWGMHGLPPGLLTRQRVLRYGERELFSPTRMSAESALAMLEDLSRELATPEEARTEPPPPLPAGGLLSRVRSPLASRPR